MARWLYRVDVREEWQQARDGEIDAATLARLVAKKLSELPCANTDSELSDIILEFEGMAEDKKADFDDFDNVYYSLCDWGDTTVGAGWPPTKMCWIGTF